MSIDWCIQSSALRICWSCDRIKKLDKSEYSVCVRLVSMVCKPNLSFGSRFCGAKFPSRASYRTFVVNDKSHCKISGLFTVAIGLSQADGAHKNNCITFAAMSGDKRWFGLRCKKFKINFRTKAGTFSFNDGKSQSR